MYLWAVEKLVRVDVKHCVKVRVLHAAVVVRTHLVPVLVSSVGDGAYTMNE